MTSAPNPTGLVLCYQSNFYTVKVGDTLYTCFLKGLLKKQGQDVLVGDWVEVDSLEQVNAAGRIAAVLPRDTQLPRPKIANVTAAVVVTSVQNPALDLEQLDRYVTHVQLNHLTPVICLSKTDLPDTADGISTVKQIYEKLGIQVLCTSVHQQPSITKLRETLDGQRVVLAGQSGVGKSSLLNAIRPDLSLAVGEVSEKIQRGQHTTRSVSLIDLGRETYVADSPGFSYLKFDSVMPREVEAIFPDFAPYRDQCRFEDCLHLPNNLEDSQDDCAVQAHLEDIAPSRYASYQRFINEARDFETQQQSTSQKEEYGTKTQQRGKDNQIHIVKLRGKQREASRKTRNQEIPDWDATEEALEE